MTAPPHDQEDAAPALDPAEKARRDAVFERELLPHMDALYNFGYHLSYNEEDAGDLVQETYLKAYRFLDSYREGTNAKAWLFRILKNAFINQYRKKSRQPNRVEFEDYKVYQEGDARGFSGVVDLRDELFRDQLGDEVSHALGRLPEEFRTVVVLCDLEGFRYEEIAEIVGIPIGTVRSRLHRARNMLKEQLRQYAREHGYQEKR
jgi:RNA polymerase sigma factor (sigma-70 family)